MFSHALFIYLFHAKSSQNKGSQEDINQDKTRSQLAKLLGKETFSNVCNYMYLKTVGTYSACSMQYIHILYLLSHLLYKLHYSHF